MREGPNVRRTFDAARSTFELARDRASTPLQAGRGCLYAVGAMTNSPWARSTSAISDSKTVLVFPRRFHGQERGWDWNWEAIYQFGSFGDGDISAWTIASETGVERRKVGGLPLWSPPQLPDVAQLRRAG